MQRRGRRFRRYLEHLAAATAMAASVAMAGGIAPRAMGMAPSQPLPKEAPLYRSVEKPRVKNLPRQWLPKWLYAPHPFPDRVERLPLTIPGQVQRPTKREAALRRKLQKKELLDPEEFEKTIQVFAQRARQDVKWLSVQRREFVRRAKRWAAEMLLQELEPKPTSVRLILLACAAVGDANGAVWWVNWMERSGRQLGRIEYNAVINAHGAEGMPYEACSWLQRMREAGVPPDARSYAGVVDGWERVGNRRRMLETLIEMQRVESDGLLGEPMAEADAGLPYYALARTYMKVGDAPRTVAILKHLRERGMPLTYEAHKIRLEAHMKVQLGPRRSKSEIERALMDTVRERPQGRPIFTDKFAGRCRNAVGAERFKEILQEHGADEAEIIASLPGDEATELWRRANIQAAVRLRHINGKGQLYRRDEDERWMRKRLKSRRSAKMGQTMAGFRIPGSKGLPEWMTLPETERFA